MEKMTDEQLRKIAENLDISVFNRVYDKHSEDKTVNEAIAKLNAFGALHFEDNYSLYKHTDRVASLGDYIHTQLSTDKYLVLTPWVPSDVYTFGESAVFIAKTTQMPVVTIFNDTPVWVSDKIKSGKDFYDLWKSEETRRYEEYKKSPAYAKAQAAQEKAERIRQAENALVDAKISDIKINVAGFEQEWDECCKSAPDAYCKGVVEYMDRWARLMQYEMDKQGTGLTKKIVFETEDLADNHGMSGYSASMARNRLYRYWYLGVELAEICKEKYEEDPTPKKVQGWRNELKIQQEQRNRQAGLER
ncbi:MAG: hypothetical protein IJV75_04290 [Alphaproteobacteria bacterium]|nr:hypothetical protein [Alphaproteobacteria bacterium]